MKSLLQKLIKHHVTEHLLFLVLAVMAYLLRNERLLADSSYYFFKTINYEAFWIEHNRLILVLPELAPLVGTYLKLSLSKLVALYSLGHILFFYLVFIISRYVYGNEYAGILVLLTQTLGIKSGFFTPMFELYYAAGLLVIFDSFLKSDKVLEWKHWVIMWLLTLFIASAHFFAVSLLVAIIAFHITETRKVALHHLIPIVLITVGVMVFKKFNISDYEQGKIAAFFNGMASLEFNLDNIISRFNFMMEHYKGFLMLSGVLTMIFMVAKRWLLLFLFLGAYVILLVMISVSYPSFDPSRYQEQVYFPITFLVAFVLCTYGFQNQTNLKRNLLFILILGTVGFRCFYIWEDSKWFTGRLDEMRILVTETQPLDGTKFIVQEGVLTHDPNWSYPIESLIMSASSENQKIVSICTDIDMQHNENFKHILPEQYLFRRYEIYPLTELNSSYFVLDRSEYIGLTPTTNPIQ